MAYRKERMESLIAQLLAEEIVKNIETNNALITIESVKIDDEAEKAVVNISVLPDGKKGEVLIYLGRKAQSLRWFLIKKMKVKTLPTLIFQ